MESAKIGGRLIIYTIHDAFNSNYFTITNNQDTLKFIMCSLLQFSFSDTLLRSREHIYSLYFVSSFEHDCLIRFLFSSAIIILLLTEHSNEITLKHFAFYISSSKNNNNLHTEFRFVIINGFSIYVFLYFPFFLCNL